MRYDIRDKSGRFVVVSKTLQKKVGVVPGRLYGYRGAVVRARKDEVKKDGQNFRFVSFHKTLFGFVPENELTYIGKKVVQKYLQTA